MSAKDTSLKAASFKVFAIGSQSPVGCLKSERGVVLMSLDGLCYAGRVNMAFHDVRPRDTVWVQAYEQDGYIHFGWVGIGFNFPQRIEDAPKTLATKLWTMPNDRPKNDKPVYGFWHKDIKRVT